MTGWSSGRRYHLDRPYITRNAASTEAEDKAEGDPGLRLELTRALARRAGQQAEIARPRVREHLATPAPVGEQPGLNVVAMPYTDPADGIQKSVLIDAGPSPTPYHMLVDGDAAQEFTPNPDAPMTFGFACSIQHPKWAGERSSRRLCSRALEYLHRQLAHWDELDASWADRMQAAAEAAASADRLANQSRADVNRLLEDDVLGASREPGYPGNGLGLGVPTRMPATIMPYWILHDGSVLGEHRLYRRMQRYAEAALEARASCTRLEYERSDQLGARGRGPTEAAIDRLTSYLAWWDDAA